jgi:hypothetical protein
MGKNPGIPSFVWEITDKGSFSDSMTGESFLVVFKTLKQNGFKIMDGVDSDEISTFVNLIELSEHFME